MAGTTVIPSDNISVAPGNTVSVGAAFSTTAGLVGGMDTANGTATPGEVVSISTSPDGADAFGADSELSKQIDLELNNGAGTIYAVGVTETQTTESFASVASGTLTDIPFDPNVNTEHDITAQDTTAAVSATVNIVYDSPPATPTDANTINLNPVSGEWDADASSSYDITYTYGDYTSAIQSVVKKVPRGVTVLTENTSIATDLETELNTYSNDFDFMHGYVGAMPEATPSSYSDAFDNRRLSIVSPSRAYTDTANTEMVRTVGAVGGKQVGQDLGDSTTYESLGGLVDLHTQYSNDQLGTLIDNQVLPIKQGGGIKIIKDMTTSTEPKFERIYASETIDESMEVSHQINESFIGDSNTDTNRFGLEESHDSSYAEMKEDELLEDFDVSVTQGATEDDVDVAIGLDVPGVMDHINVDITVGDVVQNGGAS